jgi:signal transduction histidine kinase
MSTNLGVKLRKKYMITINQSAHSLLNIINDILDFSKIEAGKLELYLDMQFKDILLQVFWFDTYKTNKKNYDLDLIVQDIPLQYLIDSVRLKQVLITSQCW